MRAINIDVSLLLRMNLLQAPRLRYSNISWLVIVALFITLPITSFAQNTLKVCHEASHYPPYIFYENNNAKGILVEIIQQASKKSGLSIELYSRPWVRCQSDVKSGKAHALFAMINTPERQKEYAFPPTERLEQWHMWTAQYPVFTHVSHDFEIETYQPSKGVGAPLGYVVWQKLKDKNWLSPFQYQPVDGFNMLAIEKLDGYAVEKLIGLNLIKEYGLSGKVKANQVSLLDTQWYLPFNKVFYEREKSQIHRLWQNMIAAREKYEACVSQSKPELDCHY